MHANVLIWKWILDLLLSLVSHGPSLYVCLCAVAENMMKAKILLKEEHEDHDDLWWTDDSLPAFKTCTQYTGFFVQLTFNFK